MFELRGQDGSRTQFKWYAYNFGCLIIYGSWKQQTVNVRTKTEPKCNVDLYCTGMCNTWPRTSVLKPSLNAFYIVDAVSETPYVTASQERSRKCDRTVSLCKFDENSSVWEKYFIALKWHKHQCAGIHRNTEGFVFLQDNVTCCNSVCHRV